MKTSILYIFLLSVLYACDSHSLLPPKQQLDQQIAQLNDYSLLSGPLNDQLCEEIETHAQEIGNDSLLLATRQIIYTRYCRLQDTAHARMLLDRMKPYAIRIKDKHLLMNHLRMAFLHAQIRQPAECERWINEARKYAYINPQNWYITAASACLECGLYPQALIYADSALVRPPKRRNGPNDALPISATFRRNTKYTRSAICNINSSWNTPSLSGNMEKTKRHYPYWRN